MCVLNRWVYGFQGFKVFLQNSLNVKCRESFRERDSPALGDHRFGHNLAEQRSFCDERKPQISVGNTSLLVTTLLQLFASSPLSLSLPKTALNVQQLGYAYFNQSGYPSRQVFFTLILKAMSRGGVFVLIERGREAFSLEIIINFFLYFFIFLKNIKIKIPPQILIFPKIKLYINLNWFE